MLPRASLLLPKQVLVLLFKIVTEKGPSTVYLLFSLVYTPLNYSLFTNFHFLKDIKKKVSNDILCFGKKPLASHNVCCYLFW